MRKWMMETGSGPGDDENYGDWEMRDLENFSRYHNNDSPALTWIFMIDKQASGALSGLFNLLLFFFLLTFILAAL